MRIKNVLIFFILLTLCVLVIAFNLTGKWTAPGETMTISRKIPSAEDILRFIDDTSSRNFFSHLKLKSAKDLGGQDSAIVSTWCGASVKNISSLFESGAFNKVELNDFVRMPSEIPEKFDVYGVRSLGYRDIGIAARNGADCINLYIVNTL